MVGRHSNLCREGLSEGFMDTGFQLSPKLVTFHRLFFVEVDHEGVHAGCGGLPDRRIHALLSDHPRKSGVESSTGLS